MVNVCPATVMAPVRAMPVLAATVKLMVPLPVPAPDVIEIQLSAVDAVHVHPVPAVIPTDPVPPATVKFCEGELKA